MLSAANAVSIYLEQQQVTMGEGRESLRRLRLLFIFFCESMVCMGLIGAMGELLDR